MSSEPGIPGWGLYRSPSSHRVYLLDHGYVTGEIPAQAERDLDPQSIRNALHALAELDFVRRKIANLHHYAADLERLKAPLDAAAPGPQSAESMTVGDLGSLDFKRLPDSLRPRLVQLANTGHYVLAHGGGRHVLKPTQEELDVLRKIPLPQLVAEPGLARFLDTEIAEVGRAIEEAERLRHTLLSHPDVSDVSRSYG